MFGGEEREQEVEVSREFGDLINNSKLVRVHVGPMMKNSYCNPNLVH